MGVDIDDHRITCWRNGVISWAMGCTWPCTPATYVTTISVRVCFHANLLANNLYKRPTEQTSWKLEILLLLCSSLEKADTTPPTPAYYALTQIRVSIGAEFTNTHLIRSACVVLTNAFLRLCTLVEGACLCSLPLSLTLSLSLSFSFSFSLSLSFLSLSQLHYTAS